MDQSSLVKELIAPSKVKSAADGIRRSLLMNLKQDDDDEVEVAEAVESISPQSNKEAQKKAVKREDGEEEEIDELLKEV